MVWVRTSALHSLINVWVAGPALNGWSQHDSGGRYASIVLRQLPQHVRARLGASYLRLPPSTSTCKLRRKERERERERERYLRALLLPLQLAQSALLLPHAPQDCRVDASYFAFAADTLPTLRRSRVRPESIESAFCSHRTGQNRCFLVLSRLDNNTDWFGLQPGVLWRSKTEVKMFNLL